jgi:hypothetical protein
VWVRFSASVQTGPVAHPASYTMGTGSFLWIKRSGRGVDHQPSSSVQDKERVELYFYSPLSLRGLICGEIYLYLYLLQYLRINVEKKVFRQNLVEKAEILLQISIYFVHAVPDISFLYLHKTGHAAGGAVG